MDRIPLRMRTRQISNDPGEDGGVLACLAEDQVGQVHVVPVRDLKHRGRDTEEVTLPPPQRKNGQGKAKEGLGANGPEICSFGSEGPLEDGRTQVRTSRNR